MLEFLIIFGIVLLLQKIPVGSAHYEAVKGDDSKGHDDWLGGEYASSGQWDFESIDDAMDFRELRAQGWKGNAIDFYKLKAEGNI